MKSLDLDKFMIEDMLEVKPGELLEKGWSYYVTLRHKTLPIYFGRKFEAASKAYEQMIALKGDTMQWKSHVIMTLFKDLFIISQKGKAQTLPHDDGKFIFVGELDEENNKWFVLYPGTDERIYEDDEDGIKKIQKLNENY